MMDVIKKFMFLCGAFLLLFGLNMPVQAEEDTNDTRPEYIIYVNRTQNCITVMEQNADGTSTVAKVMVCSCGRDGHWTPEGTFHTSNYYEWRQLVDGSYGRYAVRFNNKILFHSVPYEQMSEDALLWEQYNLLGQNASLGCVRLSVVDAKWIYDNCKVGTMVIVYSGDTLMEDVIKPTAISIPEDSPYRNWDPTDFNANNPWLGDQYEAFDHVAYADRYADVRAVYGYDKTALYMHYINFGINEGRVAEF
ncbi:MAG: L,D-transpeptidase [Lachnospiraceae bacterium]|nr:L,D-transpeptidase [Lachnospiraceae bacterium]MDE6743339.1 L,D-transpeptidase [Lachnospiraceae bacterium]